MSVKVGIEELSSAVLEELVKYNKLTSEDVKKAVKKSADHVRDQIKATAPRRTGEYADSWTTKKTHEDENALEITVYSPTQYQLAHLLEHGHAKKGGGRTRAFPHIAPAEQEGIQMLEKEIDEAVKNNG